MVMTHKVFLYKEDFNKFLNALTETINYVKTELMPDFDFDAYNHDYVRDDEDGEVSEVASESVAEPVSAQASVAVEAAAPAVASVASHSDDVDKW
jgi:hypothetical protein